MHDSQHVHNVFLAPILDLARERLDRSELDALLAGLGTTEAELRTKDGWVSLPFIERLCEALVAATDDPQFVGRACQRLFTGDYLGPLKPILRMFGSPIGTIEQMASSLPRFNKVSRLELLEKGERSATIGFWAEGERSRLICQGRVAQFEAMPYLFDWPAAVVEHPECIHDGHERCLYHVSWIPRQKGLAPWTLAVAGAVGAAAVAWGAGWPLEVALVTTLLGGAVGGLVGWARSLRRTLDERSAELLDHDNALKRIAIVNERRYAELLAAKEDVETQVLQRTAELSATTAQLGAALEDLKSLDEMKTRFFANVSHELRTPLQLILAPLDDLVDGRTPAGGRTASLTAMRRAARRLHRLIDQLLDLARVDAGMERLTRAPVAPASLARQVVDGFLPAASSRDIRLCVEGASPSAMLDAHWIESALTNLIGNALRHCDPGDRVTVGVACKSETLTLAVTDTGPGIPEGDLARIFDRFSQSEQKEGGSRGTGLGLSIVQEAARLHGGDATVESTVGEGTCFTLTIPYVRGAEATATPGLAPAPHQRRMAVVEAEPSHDVPPVEHLPGPTADAPLVVVAEDNHDLRAFVARTLNERYRVVACVDGAVAREQCRREVPDLVVTDGSMPSMTGLQLTEALRAAPATQDVPVVLLTAHTQLDDVLAAYDAGASDYVTKPFHARELLARAQVHVGLRRLSRDALTRERRASVGMLAAEIAHYVRNPLNIVINGLPVLERVVSDEHAGQRRLLHTMKDCADRIRLMSDDLLHVAGGPNQEDRRQHAPGSGLRAAVRIARVSIGGEVSIDLDVAEDPVLDGVRGQLVQVWLNLLEHATLAAGTGGRVRIAAGLSRDHFVVTVEDSGTGVPPSLGDAFLERSMSVGAHVEKTGLSLQIAGRIIADHGGLVRVDPSEALGGARFEVLLPVVQPSPVA